MRQKALFEIEYHAEYDVIAKAIKRYKRRRGGIRIDTVYFTPYGKIIYRKYDAWYLKLPPNQEELFFKVKLILAILNRSERRKEYWNPQGLPHWFSLNCYYIIKKHFPELFQKTIRVLFIPHHPEEFFPEEQIKAWREKYNDTEYLPTYYLP